MLFLLFLLYHIIFSCHFSILLIKFGYPFGWHLHHWVPFLSDNSSTFETASFHPSNIVVSYRDRFSYTDQFNSPCFSSTFKNQYIYHFCAIINKESQNVSENRLYRQNTMEYVKTMFKISRTFAFFHDGLFLDGTFKCSAISSPSAKVISSSLSSFFLYFVTHFSPFYHLFPSAMFGRQRKENRDQKRKNKK